MTSTIVSSSSSSSASPGPKKAPSSSSSHPPTHLPTYYTFESAVQYLISLFLKSIHPNPTGLNQGNPPTHPPTYPDRERRPPTPFTVAHSNRLFLLYPTHPPTHPPTQTTGGITAALIAFLRRHKSTHLPREDTLTYLLNVFLSTVARPGTAHSSLKEVTHPPTHPPTYLLRVCLLIQPPTHPPTHPPTYRTSAHVPVWLTCFMQVRPPTTPPTQPLARLVLLCPPNT